MMLDSPFVFQSLVFRFFILDGPDCKDHPAGHHLKTNGIDQPVPTMTSPLMAYYAIIFGHPSVIAIVTIGLDCNS